MGYESEPMNHKNGEAILNAEYYEISADPNSPYSGIYTRFGRDFTMRNVDSADLLAMDVIAHPKSKFPFPNEKPLNFRPNWYPDSSSLSLNNAGVRTLCVFKIQDSLNWFFNPKTHPFAIHPHTAKDDPDYQNDLTKLKSIFSDCRVYFVESNGQIRVILPVNPAADAGVLNANEAVHPYTKWAGFVYDGLKAVEHSGLRKSFEMFLVDEHGRPIVSGTEIEENHDNQDGHPIKPMHPPSWPKHHNDLY